MFWLKKAVSFWLMPLPASLALMIVGVLLLRTRRCRRWGRWLALAGLLWLALASNRQVGMWLLAPLENQYPAIPDISAGAPLPADLAGCRYIVILGGGNASISRLPALSRLSSSARARLAEGARLARLLPSATFITSGPADHAGEPSHAAVLARASQSLGVAPDRCELITTARDTAAEAQALRQMVGSAPFALVTSAWHMPRAMALMLGAGLHPLACPADFQSGSGEPFNWTHLEWGVDGLQRSTLAVHEYLGLLWERLRGRTAPPQN